MSKGIEKMYQTQPKPKVFNKKNGTSLKKIKTFNDILVELVGTKKRPTFLDWLTQ